MAQALTGDVIREQIIPLTTTLAADPIPNIRFNVAKSLSVMIPLLKKSSTDLNDKVKPILNKLSEDPDMDVRYYAQNALSLKFIILTNSSFMAHEATCLKLYEIYSDFAMKNPFYTAEMPIRAELFDVAINRFAKSLNT
ncbi:hypothetical protein HDU91_002272 [Kappamyces sp. JEL0680]|nr:hypothetical protein HDU91_002272 [Kappamyces sp. JEL0680]